MQLIFLIGAVQASFLFLISLKFRSKVHQTLFSLLLLALCLHLGLFYISNFVDNKFLHLRSFISLSYGPFLLLYTKYRIHEELNFDKRDFLHFIPLWGALIVMFVYLVHAENSLIQNLEIRITYKLGKVIVIASSSVYFFFSLKILRFHKKRILNQYSFTEKIDFKWIEKFILGLFSSWLLIICIVSLNKTIGFLSNNQEQLIVYLILSAFIFYLGYNGIRYSSVFVIPVHEIKNEKSCQIIQDSSDPILSAYFNKIKALIENEKLYLNPDLNIKEIADKLEINVNYISKAINSIGKQNFFEFINAYRVEEFKNKILDPKCKNFTILAVAFECGFNSKASFNRIVKNTTGLTPLMLKNKILQELRPSF